MNRVSEEIAYDSSVFGAPAFCFVHPTPRLNTKTTNNSFCGRCCDRGLGRRSGTSAVRASAAAAAAKIEKELWVSVYQGTTQNNHEMQQHRQKHQDKK
jgi:hypothetical protein